MLVEHGANVDVRDNSGVPPLGYAGGTTGAHALLVEAGADEEGEGEGEGEREGDGGWY